MSDCRTILQTVGIAAALHLAMIPSQVLAENYPAKVFNNRWDGYAVMRHANFNAPENFRPRITPATYQRLQPQYTPMPALTDNNIWQRISRGYQLGNHANNPEVQRFIRQYSSPGYIDSLLQRSTPYMHIIIEEVERRGIPSEIALLPLVESAFKPAAQSYAGAAGLWQFMPATGHSYGLVRNRVYDGRLDSFAATGAALTYLQTLSKQFNGDWMLALAAYNAGPGRVGRAVAQTQMRGQRASYWRINLPRETDEYVPRLLAFKEIINNPARYGIRLPHIPDMPMLTQMRINKAVDLRAIAQIAGLPTEALTQLNPYFKLGVTTPEFCNRIILPLRYAPQLASIISQVPPAYYGSLASQ